MKVKIKKGNEMLDATIEMVDGLYNSCMNFGIDVIKYDLGTRMSPLIYNECYLHPTKEELLKSL